MVEHLAVDEKVALFELLSKAADHHDTSKPEVRFDLKGLVSQLAAPLLQAAMAKIVEDPSLVGHLLEKLFGGKKPVAVTPEPTVFHNAPAPAAVPAPAPPTAPAAVLPDEIALQLVEVLGPNRSGRTPRAAHVDPSGLIVLEDGTSSLDDGSTLVFDVAVKAKGEGLRIDLDPAKTPPGMVNHPELLGKQRYIAEDAATGEELGHIGGKGLADLDHDDSGVSFVPNRYAETGGMAISVRLKRKGGPVRIYGEIGDAESASFVTPEIR